MTQSPPLSTPWRVLGLDPGLQITGYAILEARPLGPHVCEAGVVRSTEKEPTTDVAKRIRVLYDGILEVVEQFRPTVVAVESLFSHYDHPRTAILMGHARGVLLLAATWHGASVVNYTAPRVKKTMTGHGRASKEQMKRAVMHELRLPRLPEPADVADALAVALCHYHVVRRHEREGA
jgi:crossover junction endodeoxyribonuclease RuvC